MTKKEILASFNPNSVSTHPGIFGLPFSEEHAEVIVFPVPWDVTTSYSAGSSHGPAAVLSASYQVDLLDPLVEKAYKLGLFMVPVSGKWQTKNNFYRTRAEKHIAALERGKDDGIALLKEKINEASHELNSWVEAETSKYLDQDKLVVLLGGDHSTPLGYIKALAKKHNNFGVLQIDAHADLRKAYEGFKYSHASIMYNVCEEVSSVTSLVQVGIRDYCEEELNYINSSNKVKTFFDRTLKQAQYAGVSWQSQVQEIIAALPQKVYISFDIDGLDPKLCPNTGTPVPGGFEFEQITYLFEQILASGKTIIGLDLNEVSPGEDEWDANVGARMLWRMCNLLGQSNDKI